MFLHPDSCMLVLAPHTDDAELGCGATIARALEEGVTVHVAAFSIAEDSLPPDVPPDTLEHEFRAAMATMGVQAEVFSAIRCVSSATTGRKCSRQSFGCAVKFSRTLSSSPQARISTKIIRYCSPKVCVRSSTPPCSATNCRGIMSIFPLKPLFALNEATWMPSGRRCSTTVRRLDSVGRISLKSSFMGSRASVVRRCSAIMPRPSSC